MPLKKIGEIEVASSLDQLAQIDRFAETVINRLTLPRGILDDVAISLSEAANNAIVHGNKLDTRKKVKIAFYYCNKYLRLTVQDEGRGFSLEGVPDPRQQQNLLKTSGRGILIMRHLMDRVTFQSHGTGVRIVMDKFCPEGCYVRPE
jgi:serine/threonine-protein kinase RsbW